MADRVQALLEKWLYRENSVEMLLGRLAQIGFWPIHSTEPQTGWSLFKNKYNRLELCTILLFISVVCPVTMYHNWGEDLMVTSEMAGCMFVMGLVVVHLIYLLYRGERFERVIEALAEIKSLGRRHQDRPEEVLNVGKWLGVIAMVYYVGAIGITVFSTFAMPVYCLRKREFVIRFLLPYDYKPSPYFEPTIAVLIAMFIYGVWIVVNVNALLLSIFAQTTFQLALLNHNIVNVVATPSKTIENRTKSSNTARVRGSMALKPTTEDYVVNIADSDRKMLCKVTIVGKFKKTLVMQDYKVLHEKAALQFRHCAMHHQAITRFIPEIQSAFGTIIFYQFICVVCPVKIAIILVLYGEVIDEKTYFIIGLVLTAMTQQGFICYLAEKLTAESESVREAVIGCDWFGASEEFKRSMRIVMSRSNQPLELKPAGIPVTMATFHGVLKLTFNFYMSLSAMVDTSLQGQP